MSPSVNKSFRTLVRPQGKTPSGTLPLSPLDKLPKYRRQMGMVQVFTTPGCQPAKVIREALSKALNHYYPLAGRVVESEEGDLEVVCTGDGAWFIEASADCTLKDVNFLELPFVNISDKDILPYSRPGVDPENFLVMIQVTEFTCGGLAVGHLVNHVVFDFKGYTQFIKAVTEMARGLIRPTVTPIWSRDSIPGPPRQSQIKLPVWVPKDSIYEYSMIHISLDNINQLKSQFGAKKGRRCSTFEALAAKLWQSWNRVVVQDPQLQVKLRFTVDVRHSLLHQAALPQVGYYGNCIYTKMIGASSENLAGASLEEVIDAIKHAKESVLTDFWNWIRGETVDDIMVSNLDDVLGVVDWRAVGFTEGDYGWGAPTRWGPTGLGMNHLGPICAIGPPPAQLQGVCLYTRAVTKEKFAAFLREIKSVEPLCRIASSL